MKPIKPFFSIMCMALLLSACGGSQVTAPLKPLADVYAEMGENDARLAEAFQAVYKSKDRSEQQTLQQRASSLAEEVRTENARLAEKAGELGQQLQGQSINCETDLFTVKEAVFTTVDAQPNFANILITISGEQPITGEYMISLENEDGVSVLKSPAFSNSENGTISINFRITKDVRRAQLIANTTKIVITAKNAVQNTSSNENDGMTQGDGEPEAESAFVGNEDISSQQGNSIFVGGVTITIGAPLVATIRQASNVTWDYNADYGVICNIGNVWIPIDDEDLTRQGREVINAITSDMANGIAFSLDYIKPTAKIKSFETN